MKRFFTLDYWIDDGWYVGRLREVPGAISQGETLEQLKENIGDAYRMLMSASLPLKEEGANSVEIVVEV